MSKKIVYTPPQEIISYSGKRPNMPIFDETDVRDYEKVETFRLRMQELNQDGKLQACFINGDGSGSITRRTKKDVLAPLGIDMVGDITVNTGNSCWELAYDPIESTLLVDNRAQKKVLKFSF